MVKKGLSFEVKRAEMKTAEGVTFIYPIHGPNTYDNVMTRIDKAGLKRPTFNQNISLLNSAFQSLDSLEDSDTHNLLDSSEILNENLQSIYEAMIDFWLVSDTAILYLPNNEGVYIQDHPKRNEKSLPIMIKSELEQIISQEKNSREKSVRFVESDYLIEKQEDQDEDTIGELGKKDLRKNPFIIGLTGSKKSARMLSYISDKFHDKAILYSYTPEEITAPIIKIASLSFDWDSRFLEIDSISRDFGSLHNVCAFGVK